MQELPWHNLVGSFLLWLDDYVLRQGEAFSNATMTLYPSNTRINGLYAYSAPYKQWVSNYAVTGANIPSGVFDGATFIPRGTSGLKVDFENGRALFTSDVASTGFTVSGAIKDFNVQFSAEEPQVLLYDYKWFLNPKYPKLPISGLKENELTYPALYVNFQPKRNEPYAMGGMDNSIVNFRVLALTDTIFQRVAIDQLFMDAARRYFPLFSSAELPYDVYGDFKSGLYNYLTLCGTKDSSDLVCIDEVNISTLDNKINKSVGSSVYITVADFKMGIPRYPRL